MIERWLDVEAALAAGQAELGIILAAAADAIARGARVERLDLDAVKRDRAATAHPIGPIVRALERACGAMVTAHERDMSAGRAE
jgi:adenylosuccinate lyase